MSDRTGLIAAIRAATSAMASDDPATRLRRAMDRVQRLLTDSPFGKPQSGSVPLRRMILGNCNSRPQVDGRLHQAGTRNR